MWRVWHCALLWMLYAGIEGQNRSRGRIQQSEPEVQNNKRSPFRSWNSRMYPIWKGSEAQKRDCWKGGQVTFSLQNDAPTLTGAKATFYIQLNFPQNQTVQPDGQVVWNQNYTGNGTWAPVYPDEATEGADCTFPDGSPFPHDAEKRRSKFVYVWQAWGKYWQVVDGPSSNLTVETDGISLGSYTMEVVVYHYRGRQKFIPMGSTSSQFVITDQIPVSVDVTQVLDLNQQDQRFIQNRAVSFSVGVHDPSKYLQAADISFSWDFGDQSGTLITRNTGVTHTYVSLGAFKAKVVVQAAIPITPCGSTAAVGTTAAQVVTTALPLGPTTALPSGPTTAPLPGPTTEAAGSQTAFSSTAAPTNSTLLNVEPNLLVTEAPENELNAEVASDAPEEDPVIGTESPNAEATPAGNDIESATEVQEAVPGAEAVANEDTEANQTVASSTAPVVAGAVPTDQVPEQPAVTEEAESANGIVEEAPAILPTQAVANEAGEVTVVNTNTEAAAGEVLVLAKREVAEGPMAGCSLYRYGTFATDLDIVSGIESVQIVQVEPVVAAGLENTVDLTVTCQGSVPREACTVVSGPDCETPQETVCTPVEPSSDCQLVLRQVFNNTGVFCVNVSLADDVSLAVASAQVSVSAGAASSLNGIAVIGGILLAVLAVATVAYTYRRVKLYTPLRSERSAGSWFPDRPSLRLFFQNALGRSASGEHSPLLNGRMV
ncbi:melanocyte protein PMEL [Hyperolius riggenbachi]|uniref:melanocyte protein PMEL n=1 Tax=Hyperolius riggenbachi TaxID=752182 RepID=UPI0035A28C78